METEENVIIRFRIKQFIEKNTSQLKLSEDETSREIRFLEFSNFTYKRIDFDLYEATSNFDFQVDVYYKNNSAGECGSGWMGSNINGRFEIKFSFNKDNDYNTTVKEYKEFFQ